VSAPISQRLRCLFSGHDWRTAIGPRDGFFRRCRRCYATAPIEESEVPTPVVGEDSPRSEAAAEPEGIEASSNGLAEERPAPDAQPAADEQMLAGGEARLF